MARKIFILALLFLSLVAMPDLAGAVTRPQNGVVKQYYPGGQLRYVGRYKEGQLVLARNYYPNGKLKSEYRYKDKRPYLIRLFYEDGQLQSIWSKKNGGSKTCYPDGRLKAKVETDLKGKQGVLPSEFSP